MTNHKATPEQWAQIEDWADSLGSHISNACLLELRARVELLEATQHAHIETVQPSVKDSLTAGPAPAGSLVERVAAARARAGIDQEDRAVLARWGRPAIKPIPVSERLPGPEDCLGRPFEETDAGYCWWWFPEREEWWFVEAVIWRAGSYHNWTPISATHWLPHHALPVPQPEAGQ
jgi:hypothetical protein